MGRVTKRTGNELNVKRMKDGREGARGRGRERTKEYYIKNI